MFGRPAVVRRRPLLRAAAVGGTYAAGRSTGRRAAEAEARQDQTAAQQVPAQAGRPESAQPSVPDQLSRLAALHQQGALTDEEFATAKAQLLGS